MPKPLLQLNEVAIRSLREHSETGMGFYIGNGRLAQEQIERVLVVSGNHYVVPFDHPEFFSVVDLLEGEPFPGEVTEHITLTAFVPAPSRHTVQLPPEYHPTAGAIALIGSATVSRPTVFHRFTGSPVDPRLTGSTLAKDTYLTTQLDQSYANTGFAAVGRYALPLPTPASHVFEYEIPAGTHLLVGTVLPSFGQAGGGVEVKLLAPTTVNLRGHMHLEAARIGG